MSRSHIGIGHALHRLHPGLLVYVMRTVKYAGGHLVLFQTVDTSAKHDRLTHRVAWVSPRGEVRWSNICGD
jgi:hypothetical protein